MKRRLRIVQVSDVSVGYGNFDALAFIRSLMNHYDAQGVVIEPDMVDRPLIQKKADAEIRRIRTSANPRSAVGWTEFIIKAAREVNGIRPEILVIRCTLNIPVLFKLNFRPPFVIYHATETVSYYGPRFIGYNRDAAPLIDLIVFPEENRAILDIACCGFHRIPVVVAYNAVDASLNPSGARDPQERNGRVIYFGAIDKTATFLDYYSREELSTVPIDLFGYIGGDVAAAKKVLGSLAPSVRYHGYVDINFLQRVRKEYSFSIVMWNPTNDNQRYAAPCKFFESVADGVVPVTAPHPQCKMLVERYKCGLVMRDWSFGAFHAALRKALSLYETSEYTAMVENCRLAFTEELNWEAQFAKVRRLLPDVR